MENNIKKPLVLEWFLKLEKELKNFLSFVPFVEAHYAVWSPEATNIIINSCSILESFLKFITTNSYCNDKKQKNKKELTIEDLRKIYTQKFNLPNNKVIFLIPSPVYLEPFEKLDLDDDLIWWTSYNKLKHQRIDNIKKSTLKNAVDSLAALFIIIARARELTKDIVQYGLLQIEDYTPEYVIRALESDKLLERTMLVESDLFAIEIGNKPFPSSIEKLNPKDYISSLRFQLLFRNIE